MVDRVGWEGQGANMAMTTITADLRPERILMACDDPSQQNNFLQVIKRGI
jgi:hypothetical protein